MSHYISPQGIAYKWGKEGAQQEQDESIRKPSVLKKEEHPNQREKKGCKLDEAKECI